MPNACSLCDSENFYDQDGKFFCQDCGTQSQDVQVEVSQNLDVDTVSTWQQDKLTVKTKSSKAKGKKRKPHSLGKPWVIYEGYQLLIKAQVDALIEMGFPKELDHTVQQLWFSYLSHQKIAFCEEEDSTIELRAKHMGRYKNVGILPPFLKKKKTKEFVDKMSLKKIKEEMNEEEFYEDDIPDCFVNSDSDSDDDNNILTDKEIKKELSESIGSIEIREKSSIFQFTTLVIPFIGLLYLQEPVLLSDMIRWATLGQIPYHKAKEIFPEELKFFNRDFTNFTLRNCPSIFSTNQHTKEITSLLEIDVGYSLEMCQIIATSTICDLNLPDIVADITCFLMEISNFSYMYDDHTLKSSAKSVFESLLGAYITIAMKCLYYFDGKHEMCDHANTYLLNMFKYTKELPSWKQWLTCHIKQKKTRLRSGIPDNSSDLLYIEDLTTYVNYLEKDVYNAFQDRKPDGTLRRAFYKWEEGFDKKAMEHYRKMFTHLAHEHNDTVNYENCKLKASSFPYSQNNNLEDEVVRENDNNFEVNSLTSDIERICGSRTCTSCIRKNDNKTDSFTYLVYKRYMNLDDLHESFRCFVNVIATRLSLREKSLLEGYYKVEETIFAVREKLFFNILFLENRK